MTRTRIRIALLCMTISAACGIVAYAAALTSISVTPSPVLLGDVSTWSVTTDGTPVSSYKWEYNCAESGCAPQTTPLTGNSATISYTESYVGAQNVACTATFVPPFGKATIGRAFTVLGPDADSLIAGPGVVENIFSNNPIEFRFRMTTSGSPLGSMIAGAVQERIERPQIPQDTGWIDGAPGAYFKQGNTIFDMKKALFQGSEAQWENFPVGHVWDDFYQTNRLLAVDCCGQTVICEFARRHFQRVKVGNYTYKIIEL